MEQRRLEIIAEETGLNPWQVRAVAELLEAEATVPFIARYRKEATGSLDEVAVTEIRDRLSRLEELDKRRESILGSLAERGLLTDELRDKVLGAETLAGLEDIYLPFRPKRRTRATVAREKGLEPLARTLLSQEEGLDPSAAAAAFVDPEKGVASPQEALAGARDIIAEMVSEDQEARGRMRALFESEATLQSKVVQGREEEGAKFRDWFDWVEPAAAAPSHRVLAVRRGEAEGVLSLRIRPPEEKALVRLEEMFVQGQGPASEEVRAAVHDGYRRLLSLSLETEMRLALKKKADQEAIKVFAENLRQVLMTSPLGPQNVLAIDPGFRTGGKVVCLDRQGKLLAHDTIYPFGSAAARQAAAEKLKDLCTAHGVEAVAVGNGTAGRETEAFVRSLDLGPDMVVVMVNESGASVYSASESARAEFPDLDLTVRGAVSIGRRLKDPLAELVKIDPKSIGVGQYQHDVNQTDLRRSLDDVVISCVNQVGVEVNMASLELLIYVSGLGPALAANIVAHRNQNGPFNTREDLLAVPRLGPKAFEQAAGFLRIRGGPQPLDASAVHPESYPLVERLAADLDCTVADLMRDAALRSKINPAVYVSDTVGLPTLNDILAELAKPGRDPRESFADFAFAEGVEKIGDIEAGMRLPGVVTNVTNFGAFVDVGVHQDGLVHISQLADRFVRDPREVVKVGQRVTVTVLEVDLARNRIALSLREQPGPALASEDQARPSRAGQGKTSAPVKKQRPRPFNNPFTEAFNKKK
ncbi:MAG: Tex family protein [Thermodesulfobacteriota bacterium]